MAVGEEYENSSQFDLTEEHIEACQIVAGFWDAVNQNDIHQLIVLHNEYPRGCRFVQPEIFAQYMIEYLGEEDSERDRIQRGVFCASAEDGYPDMLRKLEGLNPLELPKDVKQKQLKEAVLVAASSGHVDCLSFLLSTGADFSHEKLKYFGMDGNEYSEEVVWLLMTGQNLFKSIYKGNVDDMMENLNDGAQIAANFEYSKIYLLTNVDTSYGQNAFSLAVGCLGSRNSGRVLAYLTWWIEWLFYEEFKDFLTLKLVCKNPMASLPLPTVLTGKVLSFLHPHPPISVLDRIFSEEEAYRRIVKKLLACATSNPWCFEDRHVPRAALYTLKRLHNLRQEQDKIFKMVQPLQRDSFDSIGILVDAEKDMGIQCERAAQRKEVLKKLLHDNTE